MIRRSHSPRPTDGQTTNARTADSGFSGSESRDEDLAGLLSDPHCRCLLAYLRGNANPVPATEAVKYVVAEVTDTTPEDAPEDVQRRVRTWFHHGQLPALDDHGIIEFDPESGTVTLVADPEGGR